MQIGMGPINTYALLKRRFEIRFTSTQMRSPCPKGRSVIFARSTSQGFRSHADRNGADKHLCIAKKALRDSLYVDANALPLSKGKVSHFCEVYVAGVSQSCRSEWGR